MTSKEIIKILLENGFFFDRSKGGHYIYINPDTKKRIVVPIHSKELPKGTCNAILKQAGIKK